ncbi:MAG: hypothetical protein A2Z42_01285 [Candidatus Woykebacteria bacterium RBG_19FT_COMBO_43_10]|uniref:Aromatic ring-opening dioxygenase LigA n=1 Tax=Candidatus Woykebacteria bacterium RBG_19FT_COMBO_43_10 TaxID=1802598 RepID=A0A1G1WKU0_9BACT|nr:MAG: hypothetical protein A2Z42_01285 [Candidatus Woykebacteria bacterium RBG_19FT_COMBO_43_10]
MKQLLIISSVLAICVGVILVLGGAGGIMFTYQNVAREKIVTTEDASIPNKPVRDPMTLKAQADVIRKHVLETTKGKTYAEMPREVAQVDATGSAVLDNDGKPVMIPNAARNIWITAMTLTTALNLGIIAYLIAGLTILFGLSSIWVGIVFSALSKKY